MPDIDIDVANRKELLRVIDHTPATLADKRGRKHNVGIYIQNVPFNSVYGICSIDYNEMEARGYQKIDILNRYIYAGIETEEELQSLIDETPDWSMLKDSSIIKQLDQINKRDRIVKSYDINSVDDLATIIALIRPAAKSMIGEPLSEIKKTIWNLVDEEGYRFKRSHAIATALIIVMQLNRIRRSKTLD